MGVRDLAYSLYERRLLASLDPQQGPITLASSSTATAGGPSASARRRALVIKRAPTRLRRCLSGVTTPALSWSPCGCCPPRTSPGQSLSSSPLLEIIEGVVTELAACGRWRINPVGSLDLLPQDTAEVLKSAAAETRNVDGLLVNVAVGYGGRQEIADAVRSLLAEHAERGTSMQELARALAADDISEHLYTKGQPDPDLVIRTSGEQRLSGFMLWQSAHSEYYFCEAYWPDFRRVDFLRALALVRAAAPTLRLVSSASALDARSADAAEPRQVVEVVAERLRLG